MQSQLQHIVKGQTFWLSGQRAIFWEQQKALIVSDLHFGKTGHFRKSGIAIPQAVYKEDLQRFFSLIQFYKAEKVLIVGDMFHSTSNKELEWFEKWRTDITTQFILVKGNHDILKTDWYQKNNIEAHDHSYTLNNILFTHDQQLTTNNTADYIFTGHIHPGVEITGMGKQYLRFPCFYFCTGYAVLPAFSHFTGLAMIKPCSSDNVYAIIPSEKNNSTASTVMRISQYA